MIDIFGPEKYCIDVKSQKTVYNRDGGWCYDDKVTEVFRLEGTS